MAGVLRLCSEGSYGNLYAQDVVDHVGAKPAHQRGAARGVVGLSVVEEEAVHLQPEIQNSNEPQPDENVFLFVS